jgi:hypothetical protein
VNRDTPAVSATPRQTPAPPDWFGAVVGGAIAAIIRVRWLVVVLAFALTAALGFYVARTFKMNTDPTDMLSPELAFRRDFDAFRRAFPYFSSNLVIVIDGEDADRVEDGADALYQRLLRDRGRFNDIFYPEGDRFFRQNGLLYLGLTDLQALAQRLAEAQPLLSTLGRDMSLRGLFEVMGLAVEALGTAEGQPEQVAPVLARIAAVIEARNAEKPQTLSWRELMGEGWGAASLAESRQRLIVLQPNLNYASLSPAAEAMREIRRLAKEVGLTPENGVRVRITGPAAIESEEFVSVAANAELSGFLSFAAVTLLLIVCFRSFWHVVSLLVVLVMGLIWTGAFAMAAIGSVNLFSIAFAVLFIGMAIDFGIHYGLRYREMVGRGQDGLAGLVSAGRSVGAALGIAAGTAALAFFSFLPTDFRGVSELGLIAGVSMIVAFLGNLTILPALLALWPMPARAGISRRTRADATIEDTEHWLWRHSRLVVIVGLVLAIASLALLDRAQFDRNPFNLKDPSTESVSTAIELLKNPRLRVGSITVLVDSIDEIEPLAAKLRALPSVASVRSIYDYLPKDQRAKLDILEEVALQMTPILSPTDRIAPPDAEQRRAALAEMRRKLGAALEAKRAGAVEPALRRLAAALDAFLARPADEPRLAALEHDLLGTLPGRLEALKAALAAQPVDFAALPASLRQREISPARKVRVEVAPKEDTRDNAALRRFVNEVLSVAPHATGGPVVELKSGDAVVRAFAIASIIALALIFASMALLLRSFGDTLMILLPLALATALSMAIAVIAGLSFNYANIIALPLMIGYGIESGIHLVVRARRERVIELLSTTTPRAVIYSALTTIASFASLAVSSHWGQASMGLLLFIATLTGLLCYLVVLPAMLAYFEQRRLARLVAPGARRR